MPVARQISGHVFKGRRPRKHGSAAIGRRTLSLLLPVQAATALRMRVQSTMKCKNSVAQGAIKLTREYAAFRNYWTTA
ncbi:MAG TPA: hypothetical protein VL728_08485 [Cyclobacteriaceae bacterium]|nr:hypothetical protein [Cyclobacteriaceae bacterium]